MRLRSIDNREPTQVRITLDADVHEKLLAYLVYAKEAEQGYSDVKQLVAEICRAFVERGDKDFALWLRSHPDAGAVQPEAKPAKKSARKMNGVDTLPPTAAVGVGAK